MTEVRFYHLTRKTLEQVLPELLEKTIERGARAVVMTGSSERAEALTQHLWTYDPNSFLPHGNAKDAQSEMQPVWLTAEDERPNNADFLFLTDGAMSQQSALYQRIIDIFDGNDEEALAKARQRWATHKKDGHQLSYWQQTDKGWVDATPKN
jgi:DNA polymerase-3 subunit chi